MYLEHCRMNAPGPSTDNRCLRRRVYDREYGTDDGNPRERGRRRLIHSGSQLFLTYLAH